MKDWHIQGHINATWWWKILYAIIWYTEFAVYWKHVKQLKHLTCTYIFNSKGASHDIRVIYYILTSGTASVRSLQAKASLVVCINCLRMWGYILVTRPTTKVVLHTILEKYILENRTISRVLSDQGSNSKMCYGRIHLKEMGSNQSLQLFGDCK